MKEVLIETASWVILIIGLIGIFLMAIFDKGGKP